MTERMPASEPRETYRQDLNGKRRNDGVGGSVHGDLFRADELVRDHAHEPHERIVSPYATVPRNSPFFAAFWLFRRKRRAAHISAPASMNLK